MNISIDWHGTVVRNTDLVLALLNYKFGTEHTIKDVDSWNWYVRHGYEQAFWDAYDLIDEHGLALTHSPYDDSTEMVLRWLDADNGLQCDIVSCSPPRARPHMEKWLEMRGVHGVHINCIGRISPKQKLHMGYDIYVDDSPDLADAIVKYNQTMWRTDTKMILMNAHWNDHVDDGVGVKRANGWMDVWEMIQEPELIDA